MGVGLSLVSGFGVRQRSARERGFCLSTVTLEVVPGLVEL